VDFCIVRGGLGVGVPFLRRNLLLLKSFFYLCKFLIQSNTFHTAKSVPSFENVEKKLEVKEEGGGKRRMFLTILCFSFFILSLRASACGCVAISSHTGQYFSLNKEIATQIASNLLAMTGSIHAFFQNCSQ